MWRGSAIVVILAAAGCGDDRGDTPLPDAAGIDAGADGGSTEVAPPATPAFTPCPDGWNEVDVGDGVTVCDPTPPGELPSCPRGSAMFPGSTACQRIGRDCPAGDFAEGVTATGSLLHVRAGAAAPGDGSMAMPYPTVGDAIAVASSGDVVLLAKGAHDGRLSVPAGVTVRGACPEETTLTATGTSGSLVTFAGAGSSLEDVTIAPSGIAGVFVQGGDATLRGVEIDGARGEAVAVTGAVDADGLIVRDVRSAPGGIGGNALSALTPGVTITVRRGAIEGAEYATFLHGAGTTVTLEDLAIRDVTGGDFPGACIEVGEGASVTATRIDCSDVAEYGVQIVANATATLEDVVIRRVSGLTEGGHGIRLNDGSFEARQVWIEDVQSAGIRIDAASIDGVPRTAGPQRGVVEDLVVRRVQAGPVTALGVGVTAVVGDLELRRALVAEAGFAGVYILGSTATVEDVRISRTYEQMTLGVGLLIGVASTVTGRRIAVTGTQGVGVLVGGRVRPEPAMATLEDLYVTGTVGLAADGENGRGLVVGNTGNLTLVRGLFEGNKEVVVSVEHETSVLAARNIVIRNPEPRDCAATTCSDAPGGVGIGAYYGGEMTVDGFSVEGAPLCGVQVADVGRLDLANGVVRSSAIGACVQVPDYDLERLTGTVAYEGNDINVDQGTEHHIPEPISVDFEMF